MEGHFSVESEGIDALFNQLEALGGKGAAVMIRERAGMLGRYLASSTAPVADLEASKAAKESEAYQSSAAKIIAVGAGKDTITATGDSPYAKKLGQQAVMVDLKRCFDVVAGYTVKDARGATDKLVLMKGGGRKGTARQVYLIDRRFYATSIEDMAKFHKSKLTARGRVSTAGLKNQTTGRWKSGDTMVCTKTMFNAYARLVMSHVGWAKSGWITAARQIPGAKGFAKIPKWMSHPAPGSGEDGTRSGTDPYIKLTNRVKYVGDVLSPGIEQGAREAFERSLMKELDTVCNLLRRKHPELLAA